MANVYTGVGGKADVKPLISPLVVPKGIAIDKKVSSKGPLTVKITHEPFLPWVVLTFNNGQTEELSHTEALEWFKDHGVHTEEQWLRVNEMINSAMNFGEAEVTIKNPLIKQKVFDPIEPGV
jgi:hypothetical protein